MVRRGHSFDVLKTMFNIHIDTFKFSDISKHYEYPKYSLSVLTFSISQIQPLNYIILPLLFPVTAIKVLNYI